MKKYLIYLILMMLLGACATKPALVPEEADPLAGLPADEDFYLLVRPSMHAELVFEILRDFILVEAADLYPALERTTDTVLSGDFASPLSFSGMMKGDYPVFFVRRSFRISPDWEKAESKTFKGPEEVLADTLYKDILIVASGDGRLNDLQSFMTDPSSEDLMNREDLNWWLTGTPALMLVIPGMRSLPLPEGLPKVPEGAAAVISLMEGEDGRYMMSGDFSFPDARTARFWSLGLRIFLGGRLGLSANEGEREVLKEISIEIDDNAIRLRNWSMSPRNWGDFVSSFHQP